MALRGQPVTSHRPTVRLCSQSPSEVEGTTGGLLGLLFTVNSGVAFPRVVGCRGERPSAALTKKFRVSNCRNHFVFGRIRGPGVPETNWDRPPRLDDIPYRHRPAGREAPEFCPTDSALGAKWGIGSSGGGARRLPR